MSFTANPTIQTVGLYPANHNCPPRGSSFVSYSSCMSGAAVSLHHNWVYHIPYATNEAGFLCSAHFCISICRYKSNIKTSYVTDHRLLNIVFFYWNAFIRYVWRLCSVHIETNPYNTRVKCSLAGTYVCATRVSLYELRCVEAPPVIS